MINGDEGVPDIKLKIQQRLYSFFEEIDLRYLDGCQQDALKGNIELL